MREPLDLARSRSKRIRTSDDSRISMRGCMPLAEILPVLLVSKQCSVGKSSMVSIYKLFTNTFVKNKYLIAKNDTSVRRMNVCI